MNVSRRRYMGEKGGSLPYQRIEYLESDGTQYINTGLQIYIGDEIYCRYQLNSTTVASKALLSSGTGTYQTLFLQQSTSAYIKYFASGSAPMLNYGAATNTWYELNVSGNGLFKLGNIQGTSSPQAEIDANNSLYVLMRRNNASGFVGKISNFTLKRNGVNILDFIPVRVDTTGYMYDTVSGELFGNAGTGSFTLGSDIN